MQQKKTFTDGINSDVTDELLAPGQDRYRLNVRVLSSNNSTIGEIETINGNTLVNYTFSPSTGVYQTIGSKEYLIQKKIYYFVWHSAGSHIILEYDIVSGVITKVLQDSILNFDRFHLITSINFIELDSSNHLMYWTDNYNEPRKINIEKAKYYSAGNFTLGYKSPLDPRVLYRIKQPPLFCPEYTWSAFTPITEFGFEARASTGITLSVLGPPVLFPFDIDFYDPSNEYDNSLGNYKWTVATTGNYQVIATLSATTNLPPGPATSGMMYIYKNGVVFSSLLMTPIDDQFHTFTITENNVPLVTGDVLQVYVENYGQFDIGVDPLVDCFKAYFVGNGSEVNNFFKKLFQFKVQFVYDDFEVSAWSPISDFTFPETQKDDNKPDDIIKQASIINIIVPTGSSIVTKIRIAAKEMTETDFSLIAELDKSDLLIADDSTYSYTFINDGNYVALEVNESIKLYDNVPLLSQTHDIISGNRIADGLIKEGYDNVNIDMRLPITYDNVDSSLVNNHYPKKSYLKSGGIYNFGIVYYDYQGNRSGVTNAVDGKSTELQPNGNYGTKLYLPFLTDPDYATGSGTSLMEKVPVITAEIYNNPPSWASHYQIVRSKNQSITKYFQFAARSVTYNGGTTNTIDIIILNITTDYLTAYPKSTLVYDFTPGDRIRFIAPRASSTTIGTPFFFNDSEILSYDIPTGKVTIRNNFTAPTGMTAGVLFEIYTPSKSVVNDNELMYEICECYELSNDASGNLIHEGPLADQFFVDSSSSTNAAPPVIIAQVPSGHGLVINDKVKITGTTYSVYGYISISNATDVSIDYTGYTITGTYNNSASVISRAAEIELSSGDCFRRVQNNLYSGTTALDIYVEASTVSNMFASNAWDYGRPNRIDKNYKQLVRPSTIYYSEKFIPETFINGLSSVFDTNFETYQDKFGGIYKLYTEDQAVIMFQELKIGLIPVSQVIYNDLQGGNTVGASSQVLSSQPIYYSGEYGIGKNPESFAVYGKAKYGIDVTRGVVWRLSVDGLTPISETGFMSNYFTDKCEAIIRYFPNGTNAKIFGGFDIKFNEYIISFESFSEFPSETLAWNEKVNRWSTFYSYSPETMCSNGINIVSFKLGKLYTHNTNTLQANFYGVQYKPELWVVLNESPSNVKVLEAISEETNDPWSVYEITTPNGQLSNLIDADFQEKENNQYAAVLRDENTPNIVSSPTILPNALFQGDPMRDRTFLCKFRYNPATYNKLFAVNFYFIPSNRSNK